MSGHRPDRTVFTLWREYSKCAIPAAGTLLKICGRKWKRGAPNTNSLHILYEKQHIQGGKNAIRANRCH